MPVHQVDGSQKKKWVLVAVGITLSSSLQDNIMGLLELLSCHMNNRKEIRVIQDRATASSTTCWIAGEDVCWNRPIITWIASVKNLSRGDVSA